MSSPGCWGISHPMLVHLPVGGLVVLGVLEALAVSSRFKDAARNRRVVLGLVALGAIAAAACGWLLALGGGYDAELLSLHRWMGIGVAGACVVTWLFCVAGRLRVYRAALLITLIVLIFAGHFGSEITHGRGFLSLRASAHRSTGSGAATVGAAADPAPADAASYYAQLIQPLLQRRCVSCHGPEKQKGQLRLDSLANLRHGGENGAVLVPGRPDESPMIRRLLLPVEDDDHMPPDGKPQPTAAEIALLQLWINAGAPELSPPSSTNAAQVTGTHAKTSTGVKETRP